MPIAIYIELHSIYYRTTALFRAKSVCVIVHLNVQNRFGTYCADITGCSADNLYCETPYK